MVSGSRCEAPTQAGNSFGQQMGTEPLSGPREATCYPQHTRKGADDTASKLPWLLYDSHSLRTVSRRGTL